MTRETRFNLIFLAVVVALLAPGGVILFRKKLSPAARPMYLPDPVTHRAAYIDGAAGDPRLQRVAPPVTTGWVREVARQRWRPAAGEMPAWHLALASEGRMCEVVVHGGFVGGPGHVGLLAWDPALVQHLTAARFTLAGQPLQLRAMETLPVPPAVRAELQDVGFVRPPREVAWCELTGPAVDASAENAELTLTWDVSGRPSVDRIRIPLQVPPATSPKSIR